MVKLFCRTNSVKCHNNVTLWLPPFHSWKSINHLHDLQINATIMFYGKMLRNYDTASNQRALNSVDYTFKQTNDFREWAIK